MLELHISEATMRRIALRIDVFTEENILREFKTIAKEDADEKKALEQSQAGQAEPRQCHRNARRAPR